MRLSQTATMSVMTKISVNLKVYVFSRYTVCRAGDRARLGAATSVLHFLICLRMCGRHYKAVRSLPSCQTSSMFSCAGENGVTFKDSNVFLTSVVGGSSKQGGLLDLKHAVKPV